MSKPELPEDVDQEQSVTDLLESIALEETALAHVINAEGEKIQKIVNHFDCFTTQEILDLQDSVNDTLKDTIKKEMLLQFKLEDVLDFKEELEIDDC